MSTITTLIPAYKKDYLAELFIGLRQQTFQDFRVVLSDDSPGAEITRLIREGHFAQVIGTLDLTVVRGPRHARRNHEQLVGLWASREAARRSPLIHVHLDDDVIFPEFYRSHVQAHEHAITLGRPLGVSVSRRWLSGPDGRPTGTLPLPEAVTQALAKAHPASGGEATGNALMVDPALLFDTTVAVCQNWLGELSNMVFSAAGAAHYPMPPAEGLNYYALLDIGWVLQLADQAPVAFLADPMSVFRQHPQQTTHNVASHGGRLAHLAWVTYAIAAWRQGRIDARAAVKAVGIATQRCLRQYPNDPVMSRFFGLLQHQGTSMEGLSAAYEAFWGELLASDAGTRPVAKPATGSDRSDMAPPTRTGAAGAPPGVAAAGPIEPALADA